MIISVIGFGSIGLHYVNILKKIKKKKIKKIIIFDNREIVQKKKDKLINFYNIKYLKNFVKKIDMAIIATPSHLHFKYAKYFLNNNVEVLVEKPAVLKKNIVKNRPNLVLVKS